MVQKLVLATLIVPVLCLTFRVIGWDYTTRFAAEPYAGGSNNTNPILRSYGIRSTAPVDLNSILCEFIFYRASSLAI